MGKFIDLTGKRFSRLVAIKLAEPRYSKSGHYRTYWLCECDCGNVKEISYDSLVRDTKSCGCYYEEVNVRHRMSNTRIYKTWCNMKQRCYNHNNTFYDNYGGRGISLCDEWKDDFLNFHEWAINNGYTDELTIERIDVNKDYQPDNCKWIHMSEQYFNRTDSRLVTIKGITKTITEWSKEIGVARQTLDDRIKLGWDDDKLLLPPTKEVKKAKKIELNGELYTLKELSELSGLSKATIRDRVYAGWTGEDLIKPSRKKKIN